MSRKVFVTGVGMIPFAKPGASAPYDQMGAMATRQALDDAHFEQAGKRRQVGQAVHVHRQPRRHEIVGAVALLDRRFQCVERRLELREGSLVVNSSQGGGGVFIHGWAHNPEIANPRISGNHGTLAGGINVGNGETPPVFIVVCNNTSTSKLVYENVVSVNGTELYYEIRGAGAPVGRDLAVAALALAHRDDLHLAVADPD